MPHLKQKQPCADTPTSTQLLIEQPRAQPRPPTLSSAAVHKVHKKALFIDFNMQELALINLSAIECVSNQSPLLLLQ
jgi:hypothetical protein